MSVTLSICGVVDKGLFETIGKYLQFGFELRATANVESTYVRKYNWVPLERLFDVSPAFVEHT